MTDAFDPGPGWRETDGLGYLQADEDEQRVLRDSYGPRVWVREEPVPPLPTEPYSVIRVTWDAAKVRSTDVTCTLVNGYWRGLADFLSPNDLRDRITGFEVLAQPSSVLDAAGEAFKAELKRVRRITAKAVLDRVRYVFRGDQLPNVWPKVDAIALEFEVES